MEIYPVTRSTTTTTTVPPVANFTVTTGKPVEPEEGWPTTGPQWLKELVPSTTFGTTTTTTTTTMPPNTSTDFPDFDYDGEMLEELPLINSTKTVLANFTELAGEVVKAANDSLAGENTTSGQDISPRQSVRLLLNNSHHLLQIIHFSSSVANSVPLTDFILILQLL